MCGCITRFASSLRDVQELMFGPDVVVSHETIRQWCAQFCQSYADQLRRRRPRPGDMWHLDEVSPRSRRADVLVARGRPGRRDARHSRPVAAKFYGANTFEVSEQSGRELASADSATGAPGEAVRLTRAGATVSDRVLRHHGALPAAAAHVVGIRLASRMTPASRCGTRSPRPPPLPEQLTQPTISVPKLTQTDCTAVTIARVDDAPRVSHTGATDVTMNAVPNRGRSG